MSFWFYFVEVTDFTLKDSRRKCCCQRTSGGGTSGGETSTGGHMRSDPADRSLYTATRSHSPRTTPGTTQKLGQPFKKLRFYFIVSFLFKSSSAMSGALARLLFYPTLAYNVFMEKVSSRRWFDRVDDTVVLGALPFRSMTKQVRRLPSMTSVLPVISRL